MGRETGPAEEMPKVLKKKVNALVLHLIHTHKDVYEVIAVLEHALIGFTGGPESPYLRVLSAHIDRKDIDKGVAAARGQVLDGEETVH